MDMATQPEPAKPKRTRKPKTQPLPVQIEETLPLADATQDSVEPFNDPIA